MRGSIRAKLFAAALFGLAASAGAQTIQWNAAANGTFSVGGNWVGGVAPAAANSANFGVAGSYTVTFINSPTNTSLGVSMGNVTFGGTQLYTLSNIANINGGSLNLNGTDLSSSTVLVNGNSRLTIGATSELSALDVNVGNVSANNGTILVNGGTLTATSALTIGLSGGDGTVSLTGDSDGIFNQINIANSGIAGSGGTLLIANTSVVSATGQVNIGNGGVASQVGLLRQSDSTSFTQIGAVGMTIGAAANSVGTLDLVSGTFTTGTGTITINPTGTLRVGSAGVFNANGNMNINGGVFDYASGVVNYSANQIVNVSNGAQVIVPTAGVLPINSGRTWNVVNSSVSNALFFTTNIGALGNGTMILNSGTIDATPAGALTLGGAGTTGTLSLLNGSFGKFGSAVATAVAGSARVTVAGGSTLSVASFTVQGGGPNTIALSSGLLEIDNRLSFNNGTITVTDAGTVLSAGSLDLQSSGILSMSAGSVSIGTGTSNVAGTISLTGGSIQFAGPLNMNNGDISVVSPGILRPLVGQTNLNNSRITAPNLFATGTFIATDSSVVTAAGVVLSGPAGTLTSGADLVSTTNLEIAFQTSDATTLDARGPGTTVSAVNITRVGGAGEGTLVLADQASGTFGGGIIVAQETASVNRGAVFVNTNAAATLNEDLRIASIVGGAQPPNGSVTLASGGVMTLVGSGAELRVGASAASAGTLTVQSSARFIMDSAATVTLNATGTIVVNGGEARLGTFLSDPAGKIVFNSGTLGTNGVFNVSPNGALGPTLNLATDRALHHGGTFTINGGTVTLSGGTLTVGTFGPSTLSINFQSGYLGVTGPAATSLGAGQMLGTNLTLSPGKTLAITNLLQIPNGSQLTLDGGALEVSSLLIGGRLLASSGQSTIGGISIPSTGRVIIEQNFALDPTSTNNSGRIELGGGLARLGGSVTNNPGAVISGDGELAGTLTNAGELRADVTQTLLVSGAFTANTGRLTANGGQIEVLSNLSNSGSIDLTDGVFYAAPGMTNAAAGRVTGRGTLRSNGAISNLGTITFSSGTSDVNAPTFTNSGRTIVTGTSVTTFFGAVTNNSGSELRVSTGATAVFLGDVTGASFITGGGVKIFEAGASGLLATPGDSIVEAFGNLSLQHIRERSLTINGGIVGIQINGTAAGVSRLEELDISGVPSNWDGQFDLSNNALIVDYATISPRATVADYLNTGFANGAWNGQGISSSSAALQSNRAIGIAEAIDVGSPSVFLGQSVDSTSMLLRFTLPGDANLDAIVNISDFSLLASNFNTPSYWAKGDFNYDGITNISDFALLASNFNQSLPIDLPRSTVPEPFGLSLLSLTLFARRRKVGAAVERG